MKTLRKLRALPLLLVLMALLALPALAASEYQDGDFKFTLNQARATITGYTGEGGTVVVPSQVQLGGSFFPVSALNSNTFHGNTTITSVTLPDSITDVASDSFESCSNLNYVKLPAGLKTLNSCLFNKCGSLKTVVMPEGDVVLKMMCFWDCSSLTGITMDNITSVGSDAFLHCFSLQKVDLPKATEIGASAFRGCTSLTDVKLGNNLNSIGASAFADCSSLTNVDLGTSVQTIYDNAFRRTGVFSISIPDSVNYCESQLFLECPYLTTVYFNGKNIGWNTFKGCSNLTDVFLSDRLERISNYVFEDDVKFTSITIPKGTRVDGNAFRNAPVFTTIYGCKNSSAEEYADKNGLVFIPLNEPEEQTISVSKNSFTMALNSTLSLDASSSSGIVDYQTSDPSVATVSADGTVTTQGVGQAIITITAPETDEYQSASRLVEIIVCPKKNKIKSVSGNKKAVTVKWTRDTAAQGYLVQWCKKSSFKGAKSATITTNGTVSKVIKKPGKGKWYFRVGSYKTINGKKQCVWSKSVSKTLK